MCLLCKTILKIIYLIIILWISLENGECFDFNQSLGCVYPTLYIIRLLGRVYHFGLRICYPCSPNIKKSASTWSHCVALQKFKVINCLNNTFEQTISFSFENSSCRSRLNMLAALTKKESKILFQRFFQTF